MDGDLQDVSYLTHIRDVALMPGERVTHVFSPSAGLRDEPPVEGHLLITTDQRILAFSQEDGKAQTHIVPVEELAGVLVRSGARGFGSLIQGLVVVAGGLVIYLVVAYWLTGHIDGPSVPLIGMDVGPLLLLLAVIAGVVLVGRYYFVKDTGSVVFQGHNWLFAFPYHSDRSKLQVYQLVNTAFIARRSLNGHNRHLGREAVSGWASATRGASVDSVDQSEAYGFPPSRE